jgi:hypothetical protein
VKKRNDALDEYYWIHITDNPGPHDGRGIYKSNSPQDKPPVWLDSFVTGVLDNIGKQIGSSLTEKEKPPSSKK